MLHRTMYLALERLILIVLSIVICIQCANFNIGGHFLYASLSQLELLWHDEQGIVRIFEDMIDENPSKWPILKE